MAYQDLREFVRALEKNDELKRIPFEVDPRLEITEFADRAVKQGGPALLFERPTGFKIPVLVNAFASMRKMEIALEVQSVEEVAQRIVEFLEMRMPEGIIGKLKMLPKLAEMGAFFPKIVSKGLPRVAMLAGRRRALHYATAGILAQSRHGQAQLRHVPHAGV
jgi:4-hydroxy-3-polyprenylbenzoate decarboxylase